MALGRTSARTTPPSGRRATRISERLLSIQISIESSNKRLLIILLSPLPPIMVIRIYDWTVLLGRRGLINQLLATADWTASPLPCSTAGAILAFVISFGKLMPACF
jgi:ABC-type spermidine/putrescine transport system permease subunit I